MKKFNRQRSLFSTAILPISIILSGCSTSQAPQTSVQSTHLVSPVVSAQTQQLTSDEIKSVLQTSTNAAYKLGPSDVISVTVYMHPELDVPTPNASGSGGGALITSDGAVQLPLIGNVNLGGLSLAQANERVTNAYAQYIVQPKVAIQLQQAQSMRYYLLGAFSDPGVKYPVRPLPLLDALALGGSVDIAGADLYQAYVAQGSVKLPVDLHSLLVEGDLTQNVPLVPGDAIVIPTVANENAFVFGSVTKPGEVPFTSSGLSLLQALSTAGLDLPSMTNAQLSQVHIIRGQGAEAEFYVVNARMIMNGQATSFALVPGDIIFVPPDGIATWNQVINQLLPSLETVSAILNPFVAIKYLRQ